MPNTDPFQDYTRQYSGEVLPIAKPTSDFIPGKGHKRHPSESELHAQNAAVKDTMQVESKTELELYIDSLKPIEKIALLMIQDLAKSKKNLSKSGKVTKASFEVAMRGQGYDEEQAKKIAEGRDVYWEIYKKVQSMKAEKKGVVE